MKFSNVKFLALSLLLVACDGNFLTSEQIMASWLGKNVNQVIDEWGYPDEERSVAGKKLLVWSESETVSSPTVEHEEGYVKEVSPKKDKYSKTKIIDHGFIKTEVCSREFEVNKNNIIIGWNLRGNSCPVYDYVESKPNIDRPIRRINIEEK